MPELSDLFSVLSEAAKDVEKSATRTVNNSFASEDDALYHLSIVAQLHPGTIVTWKEREGEEEYTRRGVFVRLGEKGRVHVFERRKDRKVGLSSLSPICLVFEE